MKKILFFMMTAAAVCLSACSDDDKDPIYTPGDFEEHDDYFVYHGDTYQTVTLANGQTWMAEPLRYIPEGYTPSADPTTDSHIWYPYETVNSGGVTGITPDGTAALTDDASIKKFGYLYDASAALGGVEITVDNCYTFEGAQGICPTGWHIPTRMDYLGLCGSTTAKVGESAKTNESALFYDANYTGSKLSIFNNAGWNYVLSGSRMQSNFAATPSYHIMQLWSGNTSLPSDMYGTPSLNYLMSSTCYKPLYSSSDPTELTNIQFFGQMTTFTTSKYPEGRLSLSYIGIKSGMQVRCVKNS